MPAARLGAALAAWHLYFAGARTIRLPDAMSGALLGPAFDADAIEIRLRAEGACFERLEETVLIDRVADLLASGAVVGWFQGAMEFGPRALGARSILGDPRNPDMQSRINLKIKYRESFRPFAPVVLEKRAAQYFALDGTSPYMLVVATVDEAIRIDVPRIRNGLDQLQSAAFVVTRGNACRLFRPDTDSGYECRAAYQGIARRI